METKIFEGSINGIDLKFRDLVNSGTPSCVFTELQRDDYGLEKISINSNYTIIDIGANIGMFSIYAKKKFGCKIVSFEPVPINFKNFKYNIELNGFSIEDFELHNTAISSKEGEIIKIGTPDYNTGGSSIFHTCNIVSECRTETLHKYINNNCVYLKVDTEGSEYDILPSIIKELDSFKYIGIEYHKFRDYQSPIALHKLLVSNFNGTLFCQEPID